MNKKGDTRKPFAEHPRAHQKAAPASRKQWGAGRGFAFLQKKRVQTALAVLFWLLVWQAGAHALGAPLLLVSPLTVLRTLMQSALTGEFWQTIAFSTGRILAGFVLALAAGVLLAALAARFGLVRTALHPLMLTVRSVPVASFIILVLLWLRGTGLLAVCISFLMALPLVYANTLTGLQNVDTKLLEMARVLRIPAVYRARYLAAPAVLPYVRTAGSVGMGLCWKSGVAAEVIGIVSGSIGAALYNAKILFSTAELFAWTLVIVLVSLALEKLFLHGFDVAARRISAGGLPVTAVLQTDSAALLPLTQPASGNSPRLVLDRVSKRYGAQEVLVGCSLAFEPGETVCLMAPSGAGKTTLLRLLLGLEQPDAGSVRAQWESGETARAQSGQAVRFACAFQENRLAMQLTAPANVCLACGGRSAVPCAAAALRALGLTGEDLTKPAAQLSGGQQRRTALARAMLAPAEIVLLDEPFQGLDTASRAQAAAFLRAQRAGRTLLVVTHDVNDATLLNARVLRLGAGGGSVGYS